MTQKYIYRFLLSCMLAMPLWMGAPAQAQQNPDGSLYSRFGVGELQTYPSSQLQAMGGAGTALTSQEYLNLSNPASWADQSLTRISAGVQFQHLNIDDNADQSRLNSSQFSTFQFSFPLQTGKLGIAVVYQPVSRVGHKVQTQGVTVADPTLVDPASYSIVYEGQGGLQKATVGLGYRPVRYVSIGATLDFMFGILRETRTTEFNSAQFQSTGITNSTRMHGFTTTLGTLISIPNVLTQNDALSIGFSAGLPTSLDSRLVRTLGSTFTDTLGVSQTGKTEIPLQFKAGLAYQLRGRWSIVADYAAESWSDFSSDLPLPGLSNSANSSIFRDRRRISGGIEIVPSRNLLDPYFSRVGYRLGIYQDTGYIEPSTSESFTGFGVTGGISFPSLFPGTRIDINMEVGRRGNTNLNFVRETFYKLYLNVNIGERWFERRKLG